MHQRYEICVDKVEQQHVFLTEEVGLVITPLLNMRSLPMRQFSPVIFDVPSIQQPV